METKKKVINPNIKRKKGKNNRRKTEEKKKWEND